MKLDDYNGLNREMFEQENRFAENSYTSDMVDGAYNVYETSTMSAYLLNGEMVLWEGKGKPGIGANIAGLIFPIFWTGFALFWTFGAMSASFVFGLFGVPFILVGVFLFYKMLSGNGEKQFAITNKRLIIVSKKEVDAVFLSEVVSAKISGNSVVCTLSSMTRVRTNNHTRYVQTTKHIYTDNPSEPHRVLCQAIADYRE